MNNCHHDYIAILCAALLSCAGMVALAHAAPLSDFDNKANLSLQELKTSAQKTPSPKASSTLRASAKPEDAGRAVITFRTGTSVNRRHEVATHVGAHVLSDLWLIHGVSVMAPASRMKAVFTQLASHPDVLRVEPDRFENWLTNTALPIEENGQRPPRRRPDNQILPWGIERVRAHRVWNREQGRGVRVAVVDTGIDGNHTDLSVRGGYNTITEDNNFQDDHGHGTHVAGTIAARKNTEDVVGVAPQATLYGVKVLDGRGRGYYSDIIEGIQWCVANEIDVVNMSLGGSSHMQALADAVKAAAEAQTVIIAAAGNSGGPVGYPAAYPHTIAISASNSSDQLATFSSRGPEVDFIAPGVRVLSTRLGGGTRQMSGTSMAAPHVAGLAALTVASQGVRSFEGLKSALRQAASKLPGLSSHEQGAGLTDAAMLVDRRSR